MQQSRIICVIEDTGERRLPVNGEKWTSTYSLKAAAESGQLTGHIFSHDEAGGAYKGEDIAILRETLITSDQPISLRERIELVSLQRYRDAIQKAGLLLASPLDGPGALIEEAQKLAARMQFAGLQLTKALERFDLEPDPLVDAMLKGDDPTEAEIDAFKALGEVETPPVLVTVQSAPPLSFVIDPHATEEGQPA